MKSGETKANTIQRAGKYIKERLDGNNKQVSAIRAGYEPTTARNPTLIEMTKTYQELVELVLTENAASMYHLATSMRKMVENGDIDQLKPLEQAQFYKIITDINDKLTPKVTLKESVDAKGNKTRTLWGTNASALRETLGNEEQ